MAPLLEFWGKLPIWTVDNMMALEPRGVDLDFTYGCFSIRLAFIGSQMNRPFRRSFSRRLRDQDVDIPNMAEQQAIGTFFSRLDDLITLHQRKRLWFAK